MQGPMVAMGSGEQEGRMRNAHTYRKWRAWNVACVLLREEENRLITRVDTQPKNDSDELAEREQRRQQDITEEQRSLEALAQQREALFKTLSEEQKIVFSERMKGTKNPEIIKKVQVQLRNVRLRNVSKVVCDIKKKIKKLGYIELLSDLDDRRRYKKTL
ncbi:MAG: hypothetical protein A3I91_01405 [Candidatus Kerfeldbacteria bacterium RIFCSPLOWO2_02_FULL_42_19]|nr:MAG: hypothetical protein A3E60_00380 [Candidatus Kerfeldbacteria bacterium RIFCSPHIGHO2_12_FULL_42_13]OGY84128.1 MAG: hypothetical protein A3I91_01405 [Candidatus Kerfeldbacteria bacterium RIFCSPLOWO2_02_FULL_42_19]OGY87258.1 MAG: hypothetical protein A3G01_02875 [Candidatus Kerfeldbacteria bacterium RIFCSPLOWO2_12_FULL_43_9]